MQIRLTPDAAQAETLDAPPCSGSMPPAIGWSNAPSKRQLANRFKLHKLYYYDMRNTFDLPANFACAVFARVAAMLRRDKCVKPTFKSHASLPYDARLLRRFVQYKACLAAVLCVAVDPRTPAVNALRADMSPRVTGKAKPPFVAASAAMQPMPT